jgi:hypothetical protein
MRRSEWCGIAISLLMAGSCAAAECGAGAGVTGVEISGIDTGKKEITLICPGRDLAPKPYQITDGQILERPKQLRTGDQLQVWTSGNTFYALVLTRTQVDSSERGYTLAGVTAFWLIGGFFLSRYTPLKLIMGEDGRYSSSKFQAVVWFSVVIVFYSANVILRALRLGVDSMGINIPQNLLLLSGLSAFSFAAAKGITTTKVQNALAQGITAPKGGSGSQGLIVDLTTNDSNQLDLGDFQMLVIVLIAVAYYLVFVFTKLGTQDLANAKLADVDTTILASFGLGQGAYLAKKAVGDVGNT